MLPHAGSGPISFMVSVTACFIVCFSVIRCLSNCLVALSVWRARAVDTANSIVNLVYGANRLNLFIGMEIPPTGGAERCNEIDCE